MEESEEKMGLDVKHWLPVFLMVVNIAAGLVYYFHGEKMRAGYWFSAAAITFFATFSH